MIDFNPTKIVAVAKNYHAHAEEMRSTVPEEPKIFLKPTTSIILDGGEIILPKTSERVDHELELAVVIGKRCKDVTPEEALSYVMGYSIILDITARDIQRQASKAGMPWSEAKGYDTFAPFGPVIVPANAIVPANTEMELHINGELRQKGNTKNMVFSVAKLISHISKIMTLLPHDIIATGTPEGVGPINAGDKLEAMIEGIGRLTVSVNS